MLIKEPSLRCIFGVVPELANKNEIMVAVALATEWRLICNCNCLSNLIKGYLGSAAGHQLRVIGCTSH